MVAGRFCRTSINTVRSFTSVALPRTSFLPPVRTCISRTAAPTLRPTFANRNFFATMVNTPYVTLNDGNKMPQVGFGLWKVDNDTCADTVYNAIKTGYRLFDGACGMYTLFSRFARSLSRQFCTSMRQDHKKAMADRKPYFRRRCRVNDQRTANPDLPVASNPCMMRDASACLGGRSHELQRDKG
jgi:hypothetical protein